MTVQQAEKSESRVAPELQFFELHGSAFEKVTVDFEGVPVVDYFQDQIDYTLLVPEDSETLLANLDRSSLYVFGFTHPEYYLPTHYHDEDQIQFVVDGELYVRGQRVRPGQGMFTPAGQAYNLRMGRGGCRYLEFRGVGLFRTAYVGQRDRENIGAGAVLPDTIDGWSPREGDRGRFTLLDTEKCAADPCEGAPGPGGDDVTVLKGQVEYQRLLTPPASPDLHLLGAVVKPGSVIPEHSQDLERMIYVLHGELRFDDGRVLREDDGFFAPARTRCSFESPHGAHFLDFHPQSRWTTSWH